MCNQGIRMPCIRCGRFHDGYGEYCRNCLTAFAIRRAKERAEDKKAQGIKPKSWKTRARKAYNTRLVNLSQSDPKEFQKRINNMASKEPRRAGMIKGRVKRLGIPT